MEVIIGCSPACRASFLDRRTPIRPTFRFPPPVEIVDRLSSSVIVKLRFHPQTFRPQHKLRRRSGIRGRDRPTLRRRDDAGHAFARIMRILLRVRRHIAVR